MKLASEAGLEHHQAIAAYFQKQFYIDLVSNKFEQRGTFHFNMNDNTKDTLIQRGYMFWLLVYFILDALDEFDIEFLQVCLT